MDATYLNSNEFRVSGGRTDEFVVDRRLKMDCGVDGTKYCTVYSSTVSGSYTLVTTKESELTSNLSSVLYGIVQPGISGSLPDHSHDGSEGSGGLITAGSSTFVGLSDTPATYSGVSNNYLISTTSGVEFTTSLSGTYLYSSGDARIEGTVYAGAYDSTSPLILKAGGTTVASGNDATGVIDFPGGISVEGDRVQNFVDTFLDLSDTPDSYPVPTGKYVMTTSSGLEFGDTPSSVMSDYYSYELVQEWNLSNESLDVTVSGIKGDTYDKWIIEFHCLNNAAGYAGFSCQLNGDGGSNYYASYLGVNNGSTNAGESDPSSSLSLGSISTGETIAGRANLFLASGKERAAFSQVERTDQAYYTYASYWTNTSSEVDSIRIRANDTVTGWVRLYRFTQMSLPTVESSASAKGVQSIKVEYKDADELYISPGVVHINDGSNDNYYQVSSQFTKSFSGLSASTWYYLYVKPPSVGTEISSGEIEYTTNSGITYVDRKGHYHTSNNDWRCIGAIYTDGSSNIEPFYTDIGLFRWSEDQIDDWNYDVDGFIGSSWQEVNIHAPYYCDFVNVSYRATYNSVNSNQAWRKSSTAGTIRLGRVGELYRTVSIDLDLPIENQKAQVRSESGDAHVWVYNRGHVIPDYIYTGPSSNITISGSGGTSDVQTFLDLDDTPTSYDSGKYLISTSSGVEFSDLSIGTMSSDYYTYELVQEWVLDGDTLDADVSWDGDTDNVAFVVWQFDGSGGGTSLRGRLNNDSGSNYNRAYHGDAGDAVSTQDHLAFGYSGNLGGSGGNATLYLKSGTERICTSICARYGGSGQHNILNWGSAWTDTSSNVTTINLYTSAATTGYIKLYKLTNLELPVIESSASAKGVQSIKVEYATTSGVYINPGVVHINDGANDNYYQVSSQFTKNLSGLSSSTWYYLYAKPPSVGTEISASEIEYSSTAPSRDLSRYGFYHTTSSGWRCIGAVYSDGSSDIKLFYNPSDDYVCWDSYLNDTDDLEPSYSWATHTLTVPLFGVNVEANITFYVQVYESSNSYAYWRTYGSSSDGHRISRTHDTQKNDFNTHRVLCDSQGRIETKFDGGSPGSGDIGDDCSIYNNGFYLPSLIYTGPSSSITISGSSGGFGDRGDPSSFDYTEADLTTDGGWYDLDLSSIITSSAATAVALRVTIQDDAAGSYVQFRKNGNSNTTNVSTLRTQVANVSIDGDLIVPLDSNRTIEYRTSNTTFSNIYIAVKGWWA